VAEFVEACCVRDPTRMTMVKCLHSSYSDWCDGSGFQPLTPAVFGKDLSRLGFETVKGNAGNRKKGIGLAASQEGWKGGFQTS
jgi:putative DNA primase/helicase